MKNKSFGLLEFLILKKTFNMQGVPVPVFGQKMRKDLLHKKIGSGTTFTAKAKGRGLEEKRGLAHFRWTNLQ